MALLCDGEGCDARLGKRLEYRDANGQIQRGVTLETRYTNKPNPRYPAGSWWRQQRGGTVAPRPR